MATEVTDPPNEVKITVKADGNSLPQIDADPDDLDVRGRYVVVTFVLSDESPGWQFNAAGAVTITTSSAQFPLASRTLDGGRKAKLFDFNTDGQQYHYNVSVFHPGHNNGKPIRLVVDPGIRNGT